MPAVLDGSQSWRRALLLRRGALFKGALCFRMSLMWNTQQWWPGGGLGRGGGLRSGVLRLLGGLSCSITAVHYGHGRSGGLPSGGHGDAQLALPSDRWHSVRAGTISRGGGTGIGSLTGLPPVTSALHACFR
eukprot:7221628-Pyramimonas_sp.AAC.1